MTGRDPSGPALLLDLGACNYESMMLRTKALGMAAGAGFAGMITAGIGTGMSLKDAALLAATEAVTFFAFGAAGEALFVSAEATAYAATRVATKARSLTQTARTITPAISDLDAFTVSQFSGPIICRATSNPVTLYRIWGNASGRGNWLTPTRYSSGAQAAKDLALPARNSTAFVSEVMFLPERHSTKELLLVAVGGRSSYQASGYVTTCGGNQCH